MSLTIKNETTGRLAGERTPSHLKLTMTGSVTDATHLLAIGKDCARRLKKFRKIDHGDLLYGHNGLPK